MHQEPNQDLSSNDNTTLPPNAVESLQDEFDTIHLGNPSSRVNGRPGKRYPALGPRRVGKWEAKGKPRLQECGDGGECYLLGLPQDVLHVLLSRLPPKSLLSMSLTCKILQDELKHEAIWRGSYVNRYLWDGAASFGSVKDEVKVLAQPCMREGGKGWKKESLSREGMLDRWIASKASPVIHHPPVGLIYSLSLSYPPFMPSAPKKLVVGRTHQTPTKSGGSSSKPLTGTPNSISENDDASPTLSKMTHRQRYEALLAATTRPAPYVLSAGMTVGGVVRSDSISGKVSKGFWGPGRDANFHLRPHLDDQAIPSCIFLPPRDQTFVLWGLLTGSVVHTTMLSRHHTTHGGRASSLIVQCEPSEAHEGEVCDIWAPEVVGETTRWVTGGADGRVKYWQLNPGQQKSGKRSRAVESVPGSLTCLFTSKIVEGSLGNRSDAVKRRQTGAPDAIILARCHVKHGVLCGVTEDGVLRFWFGVETANPKEVRVDVGAKESFGSVRRMELDVGVSPAGLVASVLVHHDSAPSFLRYDISDLEVTDGETIVRTYSTSHSAVIATLLAHLTPTPSISLSPRPLPALSTNITSPHDSPETLSPPPLDLPPVTETLQSSSHFGRYVAAGDQNGMIYIWSWDSAGAGYCVKPLRAWSAMTGKITTIDVSCGLVGVGSFDGYIKIFDPLPSPPTLLRTFHAVHMSPADALVAASSEADALYHTINQIILENDLVVASIGRKVFAWRAGTGKGRQDGKGGEKRRVSGAKGEFKGNGRTLDMKTLSRDAADSHLEIREHNEATRVPSRHERQHLAAMEDLGLADGEDAVQYALMLSMQEAEGSARGEGEEDVDDDEEMEAVRAVEQFTRKEIDDMREVLGLVRRAEERDRGDGDG